MLVKNKNGKELNLDILSGEDAVPGAIECLRLTYGDKENYYNPQAFDEQWVKNEVRAGNIKIFTAIAGNGDPLVTLSATRARNFEKALEAGVLARNPEYAGFNLGDLIIEHTVNECVNAGNSLLYACIVMHHSLVGEACEGYGFVPTGFLFGACRDKSSQKQSWSVYVKNSGRTEPIALYIPEYIGLFVKEIYESLGISPIIQCPKSPFSAQCELKYEQDEYHNTLYIYISKCGGGLREKISGLEQEYNDNLQTYSIFLNINDPGAVEGFEMLKELGYEFSGLKPLCGNNEFIIMSKTREGLIDYTELKMSSALKSVFERVKSL